MIHWTWIVFTIITGVLLFLILKPRNSGGLWGSFDLETPFWILILIVFLAVWGGIFWW